MDKRELELIYLDYLDSLKPSSEECLVEENKVNSKLKTRVLEKFKQPIYVSKEKKVGIKEGQVYLMFKNNVPIYFVVIDKVNDLYEVLKMSSYYELGNENDLITRIDNEIFIVETWNSFYLTKKEIENSIFYGVLPEEDLEILTKYLNEEIEELPESKRGLKTPLNENYVQTKFHEKESEIVRNYTLRIFLLMHEEED